MELDVNLWTKSEKEVKQKKRLIVSMIIAVIAIIVIMVFYFKKTDVDSISTNQGITRLKNLEKQRLKDIENAIEDRRNARDKKSEDELDESEEANDFSTDDEFYESEYFDESESTE